MNERMAIFMAGGRGERFWPLSRVATPKHLLPLWEGGQSLLQQSLARVVGMVGDTRIITSVPQEVALRAQLPAFAGDKILAEPMGRDTAAAVAIATRWVQQTHPGATIAMLPADHYIRDTSAFHSTLSAAFTLAEATGALVTIGIPPTRPATGYGYLQRGTPLTEGAYTVAQFREKPDATTAAQYMQSGAYLWNAGIFVWTVPAIVAALRTYTPDLWAAVQAIDATDTAALAAIYPTLQRISIDYAVMEKASNVVVVPATFDWDDVGEWPALGRLKTPDAQGNVVLGQASTHGASGNIVVNHTPHSHTVALVGCSDMVVVHTADATLVMPRAQAGQLKAFTKTLEADPARKNLL